MKAVRRSPEWSLTSEREEKLRNFTIPVDAEFVRAAFFRNWICSRRRNERERDEVGKREKKIERKRERGWNVNDSFRKTRGALSCLVMPIRFLININ